MLSAHFDINQSRDPVDLPSTCYPSPSLTTFAFRSQEEQVLLLDLDSYGGPDPMGIFSLFLKRTADVLAPRLSVVFRWLLRLSSFLASSRLANVTQIPKGTTSSSVANSRPIDKLVGLITEQTNYRPWTGV